MAVAATYSHIYYHTLPYIAIYPYIATYNSYHFSLTTYPLLFIYTILIQGNSTFFTTFSRLSNSCFSFTFSPNQCAIASDPVHHPTTALAATSAVIGMAYVYIGRVRLTYTFSPPSLGTFALLMYIQRIRFTSTSPVHFSH